MKIHPFPARALPALVLLTSFLTLSCADTPLQPGPSQLQLLLVGGDAQEGDPGAELPDPLVVLVVDSRNNRPVRDQLVNFRVADGGGSLYAGAAVTGKDGLAADYWTLGSAGSQVVEARAVLPTGEKVVFATFTATLTAPPPPPPPADLDGDGFAAVDGDCNDADPAIHPGAPDPLDPGGLDSNCDGVDGVLAGAVLVATHGVNDGTCGTLGSPCRTVEAGVAQAAAGGGLDVYVAAGTYPESIRVPDGVSIYGGFSVDFSARDPEVHVSAITGSSAGLPLLDQGRQAVTLLLEGHTQPSEIADLRIKGQDGADALGPDRRGGNAYAVVVAGGAAGVVITRNRIVAGNGGMGRSGEAGASAPTARAPGGAAGGPGDSFQTGCNDTSRGVGGAGGVHGDDPRARGGAGGAGGTMDTECATVFPDWQATRGLPGENAAYTGYDAGLGGSYGAVCGDSRAGASGRWWGHGSGGSGGNNSTWTGIMWLGANGGAGGVGGNGGGGGGGGGAGGCDYGTDSYGSGGGGGGAGGLAAPSAGTGGAAGGASIAIVIHEALPAITNNTIVRGAGGAGGDGGAGGRGQPGGLGGAGGPPISGSLQGGQGGHGANGAHSGGGGGGQGGLSLGILGPATNFESNNAITGGAGGWGGAGGASEGTSGANGRPGELTTIIYR